MIRWSIEDENGCEGFFESKFFRNDENGGEFSIYGAGQELKECAEKCVEAFNGLPEPTIDEICEKLAAAAREEGEEEGFELPALDGPRGILNYCWFNAIYVDMAGKDDETAYAVEGEGDWGAPTGFVIRGGRVIYAGGDYLDYIQNA